MTDPSTAADSISLSFKLLATGAGATGFGILLKFVFDHWQNSRARKSEITPQPLKVQSESPCQSVEQCRELMKNNQDQHDNMFLRLTALETQGAATAAKLDMLITNVRDLPSTVAYTVASAIAKERKHP